MSKVRYLPEAREDLSAVWWYVLRESGIEIVQIIHGARDMPAAFRRRGFRED
jgi:plasmid stabilization system protein ParE